IRQRDRSAEFTSKYGFSVVAPTRITVPSSTAGSSVSCCALLKRWISSRKKIVRSPLVWRRCCARSITFRTSARPALTADSSSGRRPQARGRRVVHGVGPRRPRGCFLHREGGLLNSGDSRRALLLHEP